MVRQGKTVLAGIVVLVGAANGVAAGLGAGPAAGMAAAPWMAADPGMVQEAEAEAQAEAQAQEQADAEARARAGRAATGAATAPVVPLSGALTTALERNFHLSVTRIDNDLADERFRLQTGAFDPKLGFSAQLQDRSQRSSSILMGASTVDTNDQQYELALTRPLQDGSSLAYRVDHGRTSTNSLFSRINPAYTSAVGVTYTHPLARGAGRSVVLTQVRVADLGRQQTWAAFLWDASSTLLAVEEAYWDLVAAAELLDVRRGTLSQAEDLVHTNAERVRQGLLARNEVRVLEAKASAAARREAVIVAEDALGDARERLGLLMGLAATEAFDLRPGDRPEDLAPAVLDTGAAVAAALSARPDVLQARLDVQAKDLSMRYYRNQRRPTVNLKGAVDLAGTAGDREDLPDQLSNADYPTYLIGLEVAVPLHGRVELANLRQAQLQAERARRSVTELMRIIESDVRRAVAQVETNDRRLEAAVISLDLAERKLAAQTERYYQGLLTTHDLLDYQEQLAQARSTLLGARVDKAKSLASLAHLTGGYLEARGMKLERASSK